MKNTSKVLFAGVTAAYFYSFPVFSMEEERDRSSVAYASAAGHLEEKKTEDIFTCVFNKGDLSADPEDPYQEKPVTLSESFLKEHPSYQFPTDEDQVVQLGDYRIDKGMCLGRGDDGVCYLGRHSNGIYVVAKNRYITFGKESYHHEFKRLKAIGQLYSVWSKMDTSTPNGYLIIPFVDGKTLRNYFSTQPWIKTERVGNKLEFSDLNHGVKLIESMLNQLNFIVSRGVSNDPDSSNIIVSHDYTQIHLIDYGYTDDLTESPDAMYTPLVPSKFDARKYANHSFYFLGLTGLLHRGVDNNITEPQNVVDYLRAMPRTESYNLEQFNTAFRKLKDSIEKAK